MRERKREDLLDENEKRVADIPDESWKSDKRIGNVRVTLLYESRQSRAVFVDSSL